MTSQKAAPPAEPFPSSRAAIERCRDRPDGRSQHFLSLILAGIHRNEGLSDADRKTLLNDGWRPPEPRQIER